MKKILFIFLLLLGGVAGSHAQGNRDLVINELLVDNVNNYEDDYGHRVSWVELHNTGFSKANVASCYLVIESEGESISYRIPRSDTRTQIDPQGYTVFFCEGTGSKGTFHTSFVLDMATPKLPRPVGDSIALADGPVYPSKVITLALLEANGKDTIDKVTYNLADQRADVSIGRLTDKTGQMQFVPLESTTPYATNITEDQVPNHELFRQADPYGYGMAMLAMAVVLTALLLLYLCFRTVGLNMQKRANRAKAVVAGTEPVKKDRTVVSGEEIAAISLALQLFQDELHDKESAILTINRVAKVYSPWSSKLYGLTQMPTHRHR